MCLAHERLVMEFLKKIAAMASRWTLILAQFFLDNEQHLIWTAICGFVLWG
jgi:hypothetical protein